MQVLDNGTPTRLGQPDGKFYTHRAGDLYDLLASKEVAKPLGQWNAVEIKAKDGKLDFYMNGQHTFQQLCGTNTGRKWWRSVSLKICPAFLCIKKVKFHCRIMAMMFGSEI